MGDSSLQKEQIIIGVFLAQRRYIKYLSALVLLDLFFLFVGFSSLFTAGPTGFINRNKGGEKKSSEQTLVSAGSSFQCCLDTRDLCLSFEVNLRKSP